MQPPAPSPPSSESSENSGSKPVFEDSEAQVPDLGQGRSEVFDEEPTEHVPGSFLAALPQFFVFPLILVGVLTGVYLLLRFLAGFDEPTSAEMLANVRNASSSERWYQIHDMAQKLKADRLDLDEVSSDELAGFFEGTLASLDGASVSPEARDQLRHALLLIVAHKRDPRFTPLALEALESDSALLRQGALQALAVQADPSSLAAVAARLGSSDDAERLLALGAVASLAGGELPGAAPARDQLADLIRDPDAEIARNAALQLGLIGDERALPVVAHLLDRGSYGDDGGVSKALASLADDASRAESLDQYVEQMLVFACRAAARLGDPTLVPALRALRRGDRSMKVKSAALDALHDMGVESETS